MRNISADKALAVSGDLPKVTAVCKQVDPGHGQLTDRGNLRTMVVDMQRSTGNLMRIECTADYYLVLVLLGMNPPT